MSDAGAISVSVEGNFTKAELVFAIECLKTKYTSPQQAVNISKALDFDSRLGK